MDDGDTVVSITKSTFTHGGLRNDCSTGHGNVLMITTASTEWVEIRHLPVIRTFEKSLA